MRIHRLEMRAFGPFAGHETVDFDALGAQGLFLLNGPTGAGKTSVLDAVAYALYGRIPGARNDSVKNLRSHHAAEGVGPEVVCEFSAGGRRLEVRRSPEWMRPAKRGTGTTREQAATQLRELTENGWEVKSTRNDEASVEIQDLLGMSMAQFTKVVLLAQGEFAAFLRATADERAALLQKLFGTDIYQNLEIRLANDSREALTAVAAGLAELVAAENMARNQSADALESDARLRAEADGEPAAGHGAAEEAAGTAGEAAAGTGVDDVMGTADDDPTGEVFLAGLVERLQGVVERAEGRAARLQERSDQTAAQLRDAERRSSRHAAREAALAEACRLAELAGVAKDWRLRLDRHHEAQVLTHVVQAAGNAAAERKESAAEAAGASAAFRANPVAVELAGDEPAPNVAALEEADRAATRQLAEVAAALPDEVRHARKTAELAKNRAALATAERQRESQGAAEVAARSRLAVVHTETDTVRSAAGSLAHAQESERAAVQLVRSIREHAAQQEVAAVRDEAELTARERAVAAKEEWMAAVDRRLSMAAGELAAKLAEGEPCQVCGSTVHPDPSPLAGSSAALVQAEKRAKKASEDAEALAGAARAAHAEARSALAVLAERGGSGDLAGAESGVERAKKAHADAKAAVQRLEALTAETRTLETDVAAAQAAVLAASARAASLTATNAGLEQEIAQLEADLTTARAGYASLDLRRAALEQAQAVAGRLLAAVRRESVAAQADESARHALDRALAGSSFADDAEAAAALLTGAEAGALADKLAGHAKALAVNADRLASDDVAAAAQEAAAGITAPSPDQLALLRGKVSERQAGARQADVELGLVRQAAKQVAATAAAHRALEEKVAPLRERAQLLSGLADAVRGGGDNRLKMTLTSYVLAARLEQVALAASLRLGTMSDGRYTLSHTDAKAGGNRKSGLGLEVVDEWTGLPRDTSTLSGGESFMASLSLALGLADVVQHESGGLDIETLFVDEGFGSLDEQSLEQVMDALEGLRDGGRVVGLVSHVAEMKTRIPVHLQVTKGRSGSTLSLGMV